MTESTDTTRRAVVLGAGSAGLVTILAACAGYGSGNAGPAAPEQAAADGGGPAGFAKTADIPEGGGKIFTTEKVVVTQPAAGQFKAFGITCTHQGCAVDEVADGLINCPCHGSRFSISDGSVQGGPAPEPLPEMRIKVEGDAISLA
ncbi:iron-sulfur protein [Microtetraspora sp. NBRC 13810]|uniref:Rieske (2Fe-2S) protein n=1 Tax=Microtetraspora sp. NBRC 13810 TaxID=3030990 RepID=UPI0024A0B4EB|nr:Rieske (2Fe-2S) protein [Microtetraspora sp. NBRC 13810]GLW09443.1 iron-sulfur protein [Microtetraspora sp. NBRC 13810]